MNQENTYNENTVVTVGILKEILTDAIVKPFQELKGEIGALREEFNLAEERSSRSSVRIMNELAANRQAVEHLEQSVQSFSRGIILNENAIKSLNWD